MKGYVIAIAAAGAEFMYKRDSLIKVPAASAAKIAEALNKSNYQLKPGQIWHVYENDGYKNSLTTKEIKSYKPGRNIKIYKYFG